MLMPPRRWCRRDYDGAVSTTGIWTTATWRPMAFGAGDARTIPDPFFEPHWPGQRTLVEVARDAVAIRNVDLGDLPRTDALRAAIAASVTAEELVLDGYVVPGPFPAANAPLAAPSATDGMSFSELMRDMLLGSFLSRRPGRRPAEEATVALPADGPLAYVAVDLLWLDRQPLVDLPLGERKRLLESVVADGELVRQTVAVRAPAERWHGHWRALGFTEQAVKAANSRYVPGGVSRDWAIGPIGRA
jgi:ATP-dependent DNA ligase